LFQPQVGPRRQKFQQQILEEPTLIKGVERMNMVIVNPNQWARFVPRDNPYVIEVDYSKNCYSCGSFEHLVRNCKNRRIMGRERRLEYRENQNNGSNLNGEESLVVLN